MIISKDAVIALRELVQSAMKETHIFSICRFCQRQDGISYDLIHASDCLGEMLLSELTQSDAERFNRLANLVRANASLAGLEIQEEPEEVPSNIVSAQMSEAEQKARSNWKSRAKARIAMIKNYFDLSKD